MSPSSMPESGFVENGETKQGHFHSADKWQWLPHPESQPMQTDQHPASDDGQA